ncbi:MAG: hypothetical protein LBM70_00830 [Victivallales bacterium]|jgi:hypothetical protein|nr:hypothetical protein [Victivallales bacterium]
MNRHKLYRFLNSTGFSIFFIGVLTAALAATAYYVTKSLHVEPDFGGMVTIRQTDLDGSDSTGYKRLSRNMILSYITSPEVLDPIAEKYGWDVSREKMLAVIDVKERLSIQHSYIIIANTKNMQRSVRVARALTLAFLEDYRKHWTLQSKEILVECDKKIAAYQKELVALNNLKERFDRKSELHPINNEIEMKALNDQLVEAQNQFLTAYGAYVSSMEEKRSTLQLELSLARQIFTEDDTEIKNMTRKLKELDRQCQEIQKKLEQQKPDLYRMTTEPQKLVGLPNNIVYFYENIQSLQQIKLALMLSSIIEEKEKMLEREEKKKQTIERLLDSNSCDVFIREVGV